MMRSWLGWKGGDSTNSNAGGQQKGQDASSVSNKKQAPQSQEDVTNTRRMSGGGRLTRSDLSQVSETASFVSRNQGQNYNRHSGGSVIQALMAGRAPTASVDAEMERRVAIAARNLGDGVSRIVLAARMGSGSASSGAPEFGEWKMRLLNLLGGSDNDNEITYDGTQNSNLVSDKSIAETTSCSDIDVLLSNSACERFVLRCVENELPPNLIHCLRLLRVLELQHEYSLPPATDETYYQATDDGPDDHPNIEDTSLLPVPVSVRAAKKVSQLLCLLCSDYSVGEQLRPHLFGLLALSGASYPLNGVHIASHASEVIAAFSRHCLSASLVWFLHDRKMILHMTDDIKELCAMTSVSLHSSMSSVNKRCLYGKDAEKAGLWIVALRTVVQLVANSCNYQCVELLRDFDSSGGYHVMAFAIAHSGEKHVPKLLELVTTLVCCKIGHESPVKAMEDANLDNNLEGDDSTDLAESKVAMNTNAFEIMDVLMMRSIPLFAAYEAMHDGQRPSFDVYSDIPEMVEFSIHHAWDVVKSPFAMNEKETNGVDLISELLVTTLQLYSDHAKNFDLIESEYHMLSHYILAFPTLSDLSVKVLTLKTLEYVCTGLTKANFVTPLRVATEMFTSLCKCLLKAASKNHGTLDDLTNHAFEVASQDLHLLCDTFTKLLEFDEKVSDVMLDCGLLGSNIDDMLDLIMVSVVNIDTSDEDGANSHTESFADSAPKLTTKMDDIYECMCRILNLVVRQTGARAVVGSNSSSTENFIPFDTSLNSFLTAGIMHLGNKASQFSLGVFEAMMMKNHDELLRKDMSCLIDLLDKLSSRGENSSNSFEASTSVSLDLLIIQRQCSILDILKTILSTNEVAQDAFCNCKGFECIVGAFFRYDGLIIMSNFTEEEKGDVVSEVMALILATFALLASATGPTLKNRKFSMNSLAPLSTLDAFADDVESSPILPHCANLLYLRSHGFYIEFAAAIAGTDVLQDISNATTIMNLALDLIHPKLGQKDANRSDSDTNVLEDNISIYNADATQLVLGLSTRLPDTTSHRVLAKNAIDEILRLCANDMAGSSLARLASSGLCSSLTSPNEFAYMLDDRSHFLYSRFVLLLRRIAAFSMTYNDFVSLLRCIAGPIILADQSNGDDNQSFAPSPKKRIRLAVILSSIQGKRAATIKKSDAWQSRETGFCNRLETLSVIAERADRVPRCEIGGDNLNTIAMFMQKVPLEERLYKLAEQGRIRFVEIESVDASSKSPIGATSPQSGQSSANSTVWSPLTSTGFTYCMWLRQHHPIKDGSQCSLFLFDISSPPIEKSSNGAFQYGNNGHDFFSFWYDVLNQRFCVLTSSNSRGEPTCFPMTPLPAGVWHHILLTYQSPKRTILGRKAIITLFIDGRPVETDSKVDSFNVPPTAQVHIGVPNPVLASSGIVRGSLPVWDLGPTLLLSTVLGLRDATAMYTAGPDFPGLFWGDRPQRLSLAAAATSAFVMLAENGEKGSVAGALRRRKVPNMEAVGHVLRERSLNGSPIIGPESDSLSAVGLLCKLAPESIIFGFRASSSSSNIQDESLAGTRRHFSRRLVNISRINSSPTISTDALVYGYSSIISPHSFADNVQWIGGPNILLPIVNATQSSSSLSLTLRMIRESVRRHPPNLEMLQAGGGYRIIALLLRQKRIMDVNVVDQCFAFAVHGFLPGLSDKDSSKNKSKDDSNSASTLSKAATHRWMFADLDAMKYLLLNHQVWDLSGAGPEIPLRILTYLNGLVLAHSTHAAFNSRRLHLLGIIRWTLHLMLEATELYAAGATAAMIEPQVDETRATSEAFPQKVGPTSVSALKNGWFVKPSSVSMVAAGSDPGIEMLFSCKTLLRRILTFMLTPGDLEAIAGAAIFTVSITGGTINESNLDVYQNSSHSKGPAESVFEKLAPGAVTRVYLLRLLEELVVDGINEIVLEEGPDPENQTEVNLEQHSSGAHSTVGQPYLNRKKTETRSFQSATEPMNHPKHQEAQIFLSAFAGILTPVWFACILEGCREEASASAVLRLMILMLQTSRKFAVSFEEAGGFAPLVLSIPKFSTCPSIILSMLSQLLNAPILRLPSFAVLDSKQLCEAFDAESDSPDLMYNNSQESIRSTSDPTCGIFALLAECLGRNIQLASFDNEMGRKALHTNKCVLQLLSHRHAYSPSFQSFCRTQDFLEPLAQALCLVHDERLRELDNNKLFPGYRLNISPQIEDVSDKMESKLENFGEASEIQDTNDPLKGNLYVAQSKTSNDQNNLKHSNNEGSGMCLAELLHLVLSHAVMQGPLAAPLVSALFRSFPIHASPDQVEAFHMVLIERCLLAVEGALQYGEAIAIANCIGLSSVLLDRLMSGFFTFESVLKAVNIVMLILNSVTSSGTNASRILANMDQNILVVDTAHIARLTCLIALQRSRPKGLYDKGNHELKVAVLTKIAESMRHLLIVPSNFLGGHFVRKQNPYPIPPPTSRFFPLWQSASLCRSSPSASCSYLDVTEVEEPDRAFVIVLMSEIHSMLLDKTPDVREGAAVVVASLLQRRRGIMSELLITDIPKDDHITQTVDLINCGGFGALLVAHEATIIVENEGYGTSERSLISEGKSKYTTFFEWFDCDQDQISAVFHGIRALASRMTLAGSIVVTTPEEAIENEQKNMLLKLAARDFNDRTILGGVERSELARRSHDATAESHALWKRQGFDDLSSGAMQWKSLLRQLKGSCTIWEGGAVLDQTGFFTKSVLASSILRRRIESDEHNVSSNTILSIKALNSTGTIKRWKLDLTEGYERQRRRLLPNYEFHGMYNIDEKADNVEYTEILNMELENDSVSSEESSSIANEAEALSQTASHEAISINESASITTSLTSSEIEVTANFLKRMKLEKINDYDDEDFVEEDDDHDYFTSSGHDDTTVLLAQTVGELSVNPTEIEEITKSKGNESMNDDCNNDTQESIKEKDKSTLSASNYDLITGLLKAGDWPEKSYNVSRCTGLEVSKALLLWCQNALYVVDGFEQTDGEGLKGKINRLKKATTSYKVNIRQRNSIISERPVARDLEKGKGKDNSTLDTSDDEINYQHKSLRIAFCDLYSVYLRRYQLQQTALEFFDVNRNGTLIAFSSSEEREEVLTKIFSTPLPSSIFSANVLGGTNSFNYKKFMNNLRAKITSQWVQGKMSNFEFIMHMNSFAGRTYNDLTQYPVFPWVLANYESEELDLNDPKSFRDLSKPMGAQNPIRAMQFKERYEALEQSYEAGDGPPPFHYGTHYSCAAYVLYYLMRLEPFSRLALSLQGGKFDVADRLFHNIGASWKSASSENLQDVRELIPEFFYLPDFLVNSNMFDFGTTQMGKTVHDLTLPPWAKGDPRRFIRLHRQALESHYVSRHLHQWLDLIFGYKQRSKEAVTSLNTFVHVSYEGQVDLNSIVDPVERDSIIAQIQNFGQTPSRLERKPFPQRVVLNAFKEHGFDFNAIASLAALTPPFCVVGSPHRVYLRVSAIDTCKVGLAGQSDSSVGDICLNKGQLLGVGQSCAIILPLKKYCRFGGPNNGVSVHVAIATARHREVNKALSIHDGMHRSPISVLKPSRNGLWLVSGCADSTVRVWKYNGQNMQLKATLCGHDGGKITCLDICTAFGSIVSGCSDGKILVWDLRTLTFLRQLNHPLSAIYAGNGLAKSYAVKSVSINHKNGNIVTLIHSLLCIFDINGNLVAKQSPDDEGEGSDMPNIAIATDCPEWMETGIAAVTGHLNGDVRLWSIDYDCSLLVLRHLVSERVHSCPITVLRIADEKQDTLLIGDKSGKMSVCTTLKLEHLSASEQAALFLESQSWHDD